MGVYIKGMEMPMVGRILIVFPSGRVSEVSADATQYIFRETQAIPVPPHGDLIDRGALEVNDAWIEEMPGMDDGIYSHITFAFEYDIKNAPTVIPASEDDNVLTEEDFEEWVEKMKHLEEEGET